jgi:hypothetical protein
MVDMDLYKFVEVDFDRKWESKGFVKSNIITIGSMLTIIKY